MIRIGRMATSRSHSLWSSPVAHARRLSRPGGGRGGGQQGAQRPADDGRPSKLLEPLDVGIEKIMLRHGVPGAAVAITRDGKLIFTRGYGWAHHLKNAPATRETLFGLASVSKVFTGWPSSRSSRTAS